MLLSKNRLIRRRAVVGLLVVASLALLSLSFRQGSVGVVSDLQRGALSVTAPFSAAAHRVTRPFVDAWHWTTGLINARDENARLKVLADQYNALYIQNKTLQDANKKLGELQNFHSQNSVTATYPTVSGSVIAQSPDVYNGVIVIDVGTSAGVAKNDPVVAPYSQGGALIGVVVGCVSTSCQVRLITDQSSGDGLTAKVLGTSGLGLLQPEAGAPGQFSLDQVPKAVAVANSATVITAGTMTGRLPVLIPPGIPIGRVTNVNTTDSNPYHLIQVYPFVDFQDLSYVTVLKVPRP
jgi:rod shape-determining protein MreC